MLVLVEVGGEGFKGVNRSPAWTPRLIAFQAIGEADNCPFLGILTRGGLSEPDRVDTI